MMPGDKSGPDKLAELDAENRPAASFDGTPAGAQSRPRQNTVRESRGASRLARRAGLAAVIFAGLLLSGCATLSWYGQAARGQLDLLAKRESIDSLINDPATDPELAERLESVLEMRAYAHDELGLPDSRSYRHYADLERPAAVWNVIAAPADSVEPLTWCYPIVGCLAYRGYFDLQRARSYAEELAGEGLDVAVRPAVAYSTLGWFADPVLNTMLAWDEARLAGFIFHELTHERLFVPGDTAFNEAYATLVERVGVRRWLTARGRPDALQAWEDGQAQQARFIAHLLTARRALAELYASDLEPDELRERKQARFDELRVELEALDARLPALDLSAWTERRLNNAHLALVATYESGVHAFEQALVDCDGRLDCLHERADVLASADPAERARFLRAND